MADDHSIRFNDLALHPYGFGEPNRPRRRRPTHDYYGPLSPSFSHFIDEWKRRVPFKYFYSWNAVRKKIGAGA